MLYYEIKKNKLKKENCQWILMLHGIGGNRNIFKKQIDVLTESYNLLLIDLHGHGNSTDHTLSKMKNIRNDYNFRYICNDIIEVVDFLKIDKFHIMGISLGTIVALHMEKYYEERILSMILGGAIIGMTLKSKVFLTLGNISKYIMPKKLFYRLVAYVSMPCRQHRVSRDIFIKASEKLDKKECYKWTRLMSNHLKTYVYRENKIKKVFVLGEHDYVFLPTIKKFVNKEEIVILPNSGHICNIDNAKDFNIYSLRFLMDYPLKPDSSHVNGKISHKSMTIKTA